MPHEFDWSFGLFPLDSFAWSSAAATGAVAYLKYSEVKAYTTTYLLQTQFLNQQERTLERWLALQKWSKVLSARKGIAGFTNEELRQIESDAGAALIDTETEEGMARALVDTYAQAAGER